MTKRLSVMMAMSVATVGFVASNAGASPDGEACRVVRPEEVVSGYVDPEGRSQSIVHGNFGEVVGSLDSAGLQTTVDRNLRGDPLRVIEPSGAIFDRTFDARSNETSVTNQTLGGTTTFAFEREFGSNTETTDPFGAMSEAIYDASGNMTQFSTPLGRTLSITYEPEGLISTITDSLGTTTTITYSPDMNPIGAIQGEGAEQRQSLLSYTPEGYLDVITDPEGSNADLDYDVMGRATKITLSDDRMMDFRYDANSNHTSTILPRGGEYDFAYNSVGSLSSRGSPPVAGGGTNRTDYEFNLARQPSKVTRADGVEVTFSYDVAGRLNGIGVPRGDYTVNYDSLTGLLDNVVSPDGITQAHVFDNEQLVGVNWSGAVSGGVGYGYDAKGRLTTLSVGGQDFTYAYNNDDDLVQSGDMTLGYDATSGLLTTTTLDSVSETFEYNDFSELSRHTVTSGATTLYDVVYVRDRIGRVVERVETIDGTSTTFDFAYDASRRLVTVDVDDITVASYTYDDNNNRTVDGAAYDAQDRLTNATAVTFDHNAHGERIRKNVGGEITDYQYGAQGTLIGATLPNADQLTYLNDGQGRRIAKQRNGTTSEAWLYADALNIVAAMNASNAVTQIYIYATASNVPAYLISGSTVYKVISDQIGSVRLIVDASDGSVVQQIDYDAWGNIEQDTSPGFQPFAYAGGLYDPDTQLTHFGFREYDPVSARWLSRDPIGFLGSPMNLYEYAASDPVNRADPSGLQSRVRDGVVGFVAKLPLNGIVGGLFVKSEVAVAVAAAETAPGFFIGAEQAALAVVRGAATTAGFTAGAVTLGVGIAGGIIGTAIEPSARPWVKAAVKDGEYDVAYFLPESLPQNALGERTLAALKEDPYRVRNSRIKRAAERRKKVKCPK